MSEVTCDVTMSLDGFIAGPRATLERPLGEGGEHLHEWMFTALAWRERHGLSGGERNADSEVVEEWQGSYGAVVMGRRMFSGGAGPWNGDANANGWWGDTPPFGVPVFVVTHHAREPLVLQGTTFEFVTDGVEAALERASAVAGDRNVSVGGGADVVQQVARAGLLDELRVHLAPMLLGGGVRLFEHLGDGVAFEVVGVIESTAVTHLRYRVSNRR